VTWLGTMDIADELQQPIALHIAFMLLLLST
jgi:hypothetical protein